MAEFRYNEPTGIRTQKLATLATLSAIGQEDVLTMAQLATRSPTMGLTAHCSDAPGGYAPVYADGITWRRIADDSEVF